MPKVKKQDPTDVKGLMRQCRTEAGGGGEVHLYFASMGRQKPKYAAVTYDANIEAETEAGYPELALRRLLKEIRKKKADA